MADTRGEAVASFNRTDLEFSPTLLKTAEGVAQPPLDHRCSFGQREAAGNGVEPSQERRGWAGQPFARVNDPSVRPVVVNVGGTIVDPDLDLDGDTVTTAYACTGPARPVGLGLIDFTQLGIPAETCATDVVFQLRGNDTPATINTGRIFLQGVTGAGATSSRSKSFSWSGKWRRGGRRNRRRAA